VVRAFAQEGVNFQGRTAETADQLGLGNLDGCGFQLLLE
jgi:hypothetical protein